MTPAGFIIHADAYTQTYVVTCVTLCPQLVATLVAEKLHPPAGATSPHACLMNSWFSHVRGCPVQAGALSPPAGPSVRARFLNSRFASSSSARLSSPEALGSVKSALSFEVRCIPRSRAARSGSHPSPPERRRQPSSRSGGRALLC